MRHLIALPPSPRMAHRVACNLRTAGFWTLPQRTWNNAADLAVYLEEEEPTDRQRIWLWSVYQAALESGALQ